LTLRLQDRQRHHQNADQNDHGLAASWHIHVQFLLSV
jgi:hypothetical protein